MNSKEFVAWMFAVFLMLTTTATTASPFFFSTGDPNGLMGMASRPSTSGFEIESADDFVLSQQTRITSATFTGLLTGRATTADISSVGIEIYRVFPKDSDQIRTPQVPTRVNSPSDVALTTRDSTGSTLSFSTTLLSNSFTVGNSVQPGGIHAAPNQTTGGNGAVTGKEVQFDLTFLTALDLAADHYFFVPQVQLLTGEFLWLSAPKPIVVPGTLFTPDLQTWTRDQFLDPDWLRVGTDIVGGTVTYNAAFSLSGATTVESVPEPGSLLLIVVGGLALLVVLRRSAS
jgi:hypothetical protein